MKWLSHILESWIDSWHIFCYNSLHLNLFPGRLDLGYPGADLIQTQAAPRHRKGRAGKCHVCWILLIWVVQTWIHSYLRTKKNMRHPTKTGHTHNPQPIPTLFWWKCAKFPPWPCMPCMPSNRLDPTEGASSVAEAYELHPEAVLHDASHWKFERSGKDFYQQKQPKEGGDVWIDYNF